MNKIIKFPESHTETEFDERVEHIKKSLENINRLMAELRQLQAEGKTL